MPSFWCRSDQLATSLETTAADDERLVVFQSSVSAEFLRARQQPPQIVPGIDLWPHKRTSALGATFPLRHEPAKVSNPPKRTLAQGTKRQTLSLGSSSAPCPAASRWPCQISARRAHRLPRGGARRPGADRGRAARRARHRAGAPVGNSQGGQSAMVAAITYPERVGKFVMGGSHSGAGRSSRAKASAPRVRGKKRSGPSY